jgi:hypothetical protein
MEQAAADYHAEADAEERAALRKKRNARARRQFMLFVVFALVAAGVIFREEVTAFVAEARGETEELAARDPRLRARHKAEETIKAVSEEADRRNRILNEIRE